MNFGFVKIITPTVFHQRFEPGTLGFECKCSSTELSWDLYVKGGDNVLHAKGRANERGQSWCPAGLLAIGFHSPTTGTSQRDDMLNMSFHDVVSRHVAMSCHVITLETDPCVCPCQYSPIHAKVQNPCPCVRCPFKHPRPHSCSI